MKIFRINRKYFVLCVFVLGMFTMHACLKDEGNYAYIELPRFYIDTVGQQTTFEVQQSVGELSITPKVVFDGAESDLTYQWRFYANSIDTLGADKVLRTQVSNAPGSYSVELQVTQKSNNLSALMRYQVEVVAPVPSGWMVLYEKGGNTDVDLIRSPLFIAGAQEGIKRSIYSASNGASLPGKPVSVLFVSNDISYIFTTETGVKVQNTDFARAQDFNQLFVGTAPLAQPEGFWLGSFNRGALVNGGKTYWFDSDAIIGEVTIDEKGYEAAPFVYPHYTKYGGFYDQKNMRFAIIEQQTSQAGLFPNATGNARFNLNNIGKQLLFIERGFGETNFDAHKYAFFKDVTGDGRYLYVISTSTPASPDVAAINISNAPEIQDAKFFGVGNLGPCAFYGTDDKVYYFQMDYSANEISKPLVGFEAPVGEEITCMKLFKGQGTFGVGAINGPNESKLMYIATWNESLGRAKVYMYGVNVTSGTLSNQALEIWDVEGKVVDMSYKQR